MAQVTNPSADRLEVTVFGLIFEPGATLDVPDEQAAQLGAPFVVAETPAAPAGGNAE